MKKKEKMSFGQWFVKVGIKDYGLLIGIVALLDFGLFFSDGGLSTADNLSILAWIVLGIIFFGLHIAVPAHMISSFKKQR